MLKQDAFFINFLRYIMRCLNKYRWVKLPRTQIPTGNSLLGNFIRLYASAAYRPGQAHYCQYINEVRFGEWIGGIVSSMMDAVSGIFLGALGADMTTMEEYFPFVKSAFSVLQYTAWALLFLITVWRKTLGNW